MGASKVVITGDVKDVVLLDVTPLSLVLLKAMGGCLLQNSSTATLLFQHLNHKSFSTAADNQPAVDIHVLRGERLMAADNKTLGRFQLTDILATSWYPTNRSNIDIDKNGIVSVKGQRRNSKEQTIVIQSNSGLTDEKKSTA